MDAPAILQFRPRTFSLILFGRLSVTSPLSLSFFRRFLGGGGRGSARRCFVVGVCERLNEKRGEPTRFVIFDRILLWLKGFFIPAFDGTGYCIGVLDPFLVGGKIENYFLSIRAHRDPFQSGSF